MSDLGEENLNVPPLFLGEVYKREGISGHGAVREEARRRQDDANFAAERILDKLKAGWREFPARDVPRPSERLKVIKTQLVVKRFELVSRESQIDPGLPVKIEDEAELDVVSPSENRSEGDRRIGGLTLSDSSTSGITTLDTVSLSRRDLARYEVITTQKGSTDHPEALAFIDFLSDYLELL